MHDSNSLQTVLSTNTKNGIKRIKTERYNDFF